MWARRRGRRLACNAGSGPGVEIVMSEPRNIEKQRDRAPEAGQEPQLDVEVIEDLDATAEDSDLIKGGCPHTSCHLTEWD